MSETETEQFLISQGYLPRLDAKGEAAFHDAARAGSINVIAAYLEMGMEVDAGTGHRTALIAAVEGGHLPLIRYLLAAGADLTARDRHGDTALHTAVNWQQIPALRLLIAHGAAIDTVNHGGYSPLNCAIVQDYDEIARLLLEAGADPNWQPGPEDGRGAAGYVPALYVATLKGNSEQTAMLLAAGADPGLGRDDEGRPCWLTAILDEHKEIAQQFLASGRALDAANDRGWTPWMAACYKGQEDLAQALEAAGATPGDREAIRLLKAAREGDLETVQACVEAGVDINARDMDGDTPLLLAVAQQYDDMALWLVHHGADVTLRNRKEHDALSIAGGYARIDVVKALLEAGADVNPPGPYAPLPMACMKGCVSAARVLLEAGADPNAPGHFGGESHTPLIWAVKGGFKPLIKLLLKAGADVNAQDEDGVTALAAAARRNLPATVKLLLAAGADPNLPDAKGHIALYGAIGKTDAPIYEALLEAGANPFFLDKSGSGSPLQSIAIQNSPLFYRLRDHYTWDAYRALLAEWELPEDADPPPEFFAELAAQAPSDAVILLWARQAGYEDKGEAAIVRGLLAAGMSTEGTYSGWRALHTAAVFDNEAMVRVLLDAGADVEARGLMDTPVIRQASRPGVARLLIAAGADVHARDAHGETAMYEAAKRNRIGVLRVLHQAGAAVDPDPVGRSPLMAAIVHNSLKEIIHWLLDHGASPNLVNQARESVLYRTVKKCRTSLIDPLLRAGGDPNLCTHEGKSPLMLAAEEGQREIVGKLLEAGADPFLVDAEGRTVFDYAAAKPAVAQLLTTCKRPPRPELPPPAPQPPLPPLHRAAQIGNAAAAQALLAEGADVNARDPRGETALMVAAAWGHLEAVLALIDAGADLGLENRAGATAWALASVNGHDEAALALQAAGAQPDPAKLLALINRRAAFQNVLHREDIAAAREMVARGEVDIDGPAPEGGPSRLLAAVTRRDVKLVRALVAAGATPDLVPPGRQPPLLWAAQQGDEKMVDLLIGLALDVNVRDAHGNTALHLAAQDAAPGIVASLLLAEADVEAQNQAGATPLHASLLPLIDPDRPIGSTRADERTAIVASLLAFDADPNRADAAGRTPLALAQAANLAPVIELLREAGATEGEAPISATAAPTEAIAPALIPLHAAPEDGPLRHTLKYGSGVEAVAYSPDGRLLAAGGSGDVVLWETATWAERGRIRIPGTIHALAWRPDGAHLAIGASNAGLYLWDAAALTKELSASRSEGVASPPLHANKLATRSNICSENADLAIRSEQTENSPLHPLEGHAHNVLTVAFSPDGTRLASGGTAGAIHLWDAETGERIRTLTPSGPQVRALAWGAGGQHLIAVGHNGLFQVWDAASGARVSQATEELASDLHGVSVSPSGKLFVTCGNDASVRIWQLPGCNQISQNRQHDYGVISVAWHPRRRLIASGGTDKTIHIWDGKVLSKTRALTGHASFVNRLSWQPDGRRLASAGDDASVRIWDPFRPEPAATRPQHKDRVQALAWRPDGRVVVSGGGYKDQTLKVWDGATGELLQTIPGHGTAIEALAFSPDGAILACGAKLQHVKGQRITLWDTSTWRLIGTAKYPSEYMYDVVSVAFSPDGKLVAGGSSDCLVFVWHTKSRRRKYVLKGHKQHYAINIQVAFTRDGKILITGGHQDGLVKFWDVANGEELATLPGKNNAGALRISPDGARLLVAGDELQVWDVQERTKLASWKGPSMLQGASWLPNGRHVLTTSYAAKAAEVWDVSTGERVAAFETDVPLYACAISPDGRGAVVGDSEGRVIFLRVRGM